jgi:hypothetical protein
MTDVGDAGAQGTVDLTGPWIVDVNSVPWNPRSALGARPRAASLDLPEWVLEIRAAYVIAKRCADVRERGRLLLRYAHALQRHLGGDDIGHGGALLDRCIANLRTGMLRNGSVLAMRDLSAALDEEVAFVEVGLQLHEWLQEDAVQGDAGLAGALSGWRGPEQPGARRRAS